MCVFILYVFSRLRRSAYYKMGPVVTRVAWSVFVCVCVYVCWSDMSCAKKTELIEMPFSVCGLVMSKKPHIRRGLGPPREGEILRVILRCARLACGQYF